MALINCAECGKEFSDKATACPNCGCPITVESTTEEQATPISGKENKGNKEKSYLLRAILLWGLLPIELFATIPIEMVVGVDPICAVAAINTVLAILLMFKAIKQSIKVKKRLIKNLIAVLLCGLFLWPNGAFAVAGIFDVFSYSKEEELAIKACADLKSRLKSPESLELHDILVCENTSGTGTYIFIDCSGMNGFGGSTRNTFVYKNSKYLGESIDNLEATAVLAQAQMDRTLKSVSVGKIERGMK